MLRRRGWKSRPTGKKSRKKNWLIVLAVVVLFAVQSFVFIERNMKPPLMQLAKVRLRQMATESINTAIASRISQSTDFEKLIDWKTDKNGKITGFMLNYAEHMRIASDTTKTVQGLLDNMKDMPEHIPLGQAMGSAILASFGPNIPIKLTPASAAKIDLNTRYQNAGINMILVEVYIHIVVEINVIIPFDSEPEIVETELPVSYSLVVGDVPMYYFDNNGKPVGGETPPPTLSLPALPNAGGGTGGAGGATPLNPSGGVIEAPDKAAAPKSQ
jgi:sporulation protein YunB